MKHLILAASLLFLPVFSQADGPLTITPAGYFLTVLGDDGQPAYARIETVIDLTGGGKPDAPDVPDTPNEPRVDLELVAKVRAWSVAVDDPQSAQAIAVVYAHILGALSDGTLTAEIVWRRLKQSIDSALGVIDGKDWSEFREKLTAEFTDSAQRGNLGTVEQISRALLSAQKGIELSTDGATSLTMEQFVEIARRTNLAIDGLTQ